MNRLFIKMFCCHFILCIAQLYACASIDYRSSLCHTFNGGEKDIDVSLACVINVLEKLNSNDLIMSKTFSNSTFEYCIETDWIRTANDSDNLFSAMGLSIPPSKGSIEVKYFIRISSNRYCLSMKKRLFKPAYTRPSDRYNSFSTQSEINVEPGMQEWKLAKKIMNSINEELGLDNDNSVLRERIEK